MQSRLASRSVSPSSAESKRLQENAQHLSPNPRRSWILFAMCAALSLTTLDHTGLAIVLPALQYELDLSNIHTQWVMNSYLLTLSGLLLFGGKISDKLGHRSTFLSGITLFIISSISCSIAHSGSVLFLARALQGIGAAFMVPTTSAIIIKSFPPEERSSAIGIYIASSGVFLSAGPLLGGLLTQYISWRALFWINLPLGITSILLTLWCVPKQTNKLELGELDWLGLGLSILFTSGPVLCLMKGNQWGWYSSEVILILTASLIAFIGFLVWEPRVKDPLLNLQLFKNKCFSFATMIMVANQTINISFIFWAHFLQKLGQWSPVSSGFALLPVTLPIIIIPPLGKYLLNRLGIKKLIWFSNISIIISLLYIGSVAFLQKYAFLLPGFAGFGIAMASLMLASRTVFLDSIALEYQGIGGAIAGYARQIGALLGLSLFTAVFNGVYHETLHKTLSVNMYITAFQGVMWTAAALATLSSFPIFGLIRQQRLQAESIIENQLLWHSRRGMLELDILLQDFLNHTPLTPFEKKQLIELLNYPDQTLYQWIVKREVAPTPLLNRWVDRIRTGRTRNVG